MDDPLARRLARLHPKLIDFSLDRVRDLLGRLGDPQLALPPVIHVAGTNGKGSTVAFLRAMLEAAGLTAHVYTSPHLMRFNERIRVAGKLIDDGALMALLDECEAELDGEPITFFEITTAAAFLAFARRSADAVLMEVGLGGRLDATNVIDRPAATLITPVAMDHMGYLGDTLALIAGEKAGILKPGSPAIIARQTPQAGAVIEARAGALAAPLYRFGRDWRVAETPAGFAFEGRRWRLELPPPALAGRHQIDNAGTAIATLEVLDQFRVPPEAIARGLASVEWPGRLQHLRYGPLVAALPPGWELWLDGAHNPHAGEMLADFLAGWRDRPVHLIVGMQATKDAAEFFRLLAPALAGGLMRAVTVPNAPAALDATELAAAASSVGLDARPAASVAAALGEITAGAPAPARLLICGSLYLAGNAVLAENG